MWVDTLGGKAVKVGSIDVVKFPDALIFLNLQKTTEPTRGTAFDHIEFAVPEVPAMATKLAAAGFRETTSREPAPGASDRSGHCRDFSRQAEGELVLSQCDPEERSNNNYDRQGDDEILPVGLSVVRRRNR